MSAVPPVIDAGQPSRMNAALQRILNGNWLVGIVAVVLSILVGSVLIAVTDSGVQAAAGYFFARPLDTIAAIWESIAGAYAAFFRGGIFDYRAATFAEGIESFAESLHRSTPLIIAALGIGLTFRAGLFNIGGRGQILFGAAFGGWIAFGTDLPYVIHPIVAVLVGAVAGAFLGAVAGALKAFTGAHEVIVTIMLNFIALNLLVWALNPGGPLRGQGSSPLTPPPPESSLFPFLFPGYSVTAGFLLAIALTAGVWWLLERSSLGFKLRAVGENPAAARTAGIDTKAITIIAMALSGALVGIAGVELALGETRRPFGSSIDNGVGFEAITVALLGRSRAWGMLAAGILFGIFRAGAVQMRIAGYSDDIVTVVQALIVLFLAAPPLIRELWGVRPDGRRKAAKA
ncbi:MAG TPA: ABC transporter permease [Microbacteriaceae bacterium]|nr:ABC transporter permease [Microbacteriaceae bacterium]